MAMCDDEYMIQVHARRINGSQTTVVAASTTTVKVMKGMLADFAKAEAGRLLLCQDGSKHRLSDEQAISSLRQESDGSIVLLLSIALSVGDVVLDYTSLSVEHINFQYPMFIVADEGETMHVDESGSVRLETGCHSKLGLNAGDHKFVGVDWTSLPPPASTLTVGYVEAKPGGRVTLISASEQHYEFYNPLRAFVVPDAIAFASDGSQWHLERGYDGRVNHWTEDGTILNYIACRRGNQQQECMHAVFGMAIDDEHVFVMDYILKHGLKVYAQSDLAFQRIAPCTNGSVDMSHSLCISPNKKYIAESDQFLRRLNIIRVDGSESCRSHVEGCVPFAASFTMDSEHLACSVWHKDENCFKIIVFGLDGVELHAFSHELLRECGGLVCDGQDNIVTVGCSIKGSDSCAVRVWSLDGTLLHDMVGGLTLLAGKHVTIDANQASLIVCDKTGVHALKPKSVCSQCSE
eukprot:TRINITY_DN81478_c0_g1_i1.p1 TRINITY_DN81478_c0_g1~~TRINITY_DN81478_c0_g1_i1.p1  ORF type:complete len:463 (+),score=52.99 TRINITY_DN81478_c0_g1_i1:99-1487(+)